MSFGFAEAASTAQESNPKFSCRDWEGQRIAAIKWDGLRATRISTVRYALQNSVGELFTCQKWEREKARLEDLDIFASITLFASAHSPNLKESTREGTPHAEVPTAESGAESDSSSTSGLVAATEPTIELRYVFRELPPYIPYLSVSKTDQDGLSAGPAVAALNLLGTGAHLELASRFGGTQEAYLSLSGISIGPSWIEYDAALLRIDSWNAQDSFHESSWRSKADFLFPLSENWKAISAGELFFIESDREGITLRSKLDYVPRLGVGLALDLRDKQRLPKAGVYAEARCTQSGGVLGGPAAFTEWLFDLRTYWPWHAGQVLAFHGLHRYRDGVFGDNVGGYDDFHAGGPNSLRGYPGDSRRGLSESIFFLENRSTLMAQKVLGFWSFAVPLSLEGVIGVETVHSWNHSAWAEADGPWSVYLGVHLLTGGVDRVRFEGGTGLSRVSPKVDIGLFDKSVAQRYRTR
jgi:hypothetical protein